MSLLSRILFIKQGKPRVFYLLTVPSITTFKTHIKTRNFIVNFYGEKMIIYLLNIKYHHWKKSSSSKPTVVKQGRKIFSL